MSYIHTATGRRIYYDDLGTGAPLVVIPGQSGDRRGSITLLTAELAKAFRVLPMDLRDSGESAPELDYYSIGDMADDITALLDALGLDRAHILGHSLGASVATQFALAQPDRIDRLLLVCGGAGWPPEHRRGEPLPSPAEWWTDDPVERMRRLLPVVVGSIARERLDEAEFAALAEQDRGNRATWAGYMRQEASVDGFDLWSQLPAVRAATLVIRGGEDHPERGEAMAAAIPGARLLVIPGVGHVPWIERPEAAIPPIMAFLKEATPRVAGDTP